jgi:hypothetical protein
MPYVEFSSRKYDNGNKSIFVVFDIEYDLAIYPVCGAKGSFNIFPV